MRSVDFNRLIKEIVALSVEREERLFPSLEICSKMFPYTEMRFLEDDSLFGKVRNAVWGMILSRILRPVAAVLLMAIMFSSIPVRVIPFSEDNLYFRRVFGNQYYACFVELIGDYNWEEAKQRMLESEYTANEFVLTYVPEDLFLVDRPDDGGDSFNFDDPFQVKYIYRNDDYRRYLTLRVNLSWFYPGVAYSPERERHEVYSMPDGTMLHMFIEDGNNEKGHYKIVWGDENITFSLIADGFEFEEVLDVIEGIEFVEWTNADPDLFK